MFKFIERLREKPESARRRYAVGISASIMLIVLIVWAGTLPFTLNDYTSSGDQSASADISSPIDSLKQTFVDGFDKLKNGLSNSNPFKGGSQTVQESATSSDTSWQNGVIITDPTVGIGGYSTSSVEFP